MKVESSLFIIFLIFLLFIKASLFSFGKNKVIYHTYNWNIVESENFKIYIPENIRFLSKKILFISEKIYSNYARVYDYKPREKIKVLIFPNSIDFQQNNILDWTSSRVKGFTEFIKGRVVIYYTPDNEEFYHIFAHELNHAFQGYVWGKGSVNIYSMRNLDVPLWFIEGASEFNSIGVDNECEMYVSEALFNNQLPTLMDLSDLYNLKGNQYLFIYKEGQIFYEFFTNKYGEDAIRKINKEITEVRSLKVALMNLFTNTIEGINEEFFEYLRDKYYPDYRNFENVGLISKKLIEKDSFYNVCPVEIDENSLAFITDRKIYPSLAIFNRTSKTLRKIITTWKTEDFLEFSYERNNHIGVSTNSKLVFTARSHDRISIYLYQVKEKKVTKIDLPFRILSSPDISKDGRKIVFSAIDDNQNSDIYLYDLYTKELVRLTDDKFFDDEPRFLNDEYIIFVSKREKSRAIYFLRLEDKTIEKLLSLSNSLFNPAVSDDGNKIVFIEECRAPSLYVYDIKANRLYKEIVPVGGIFTPSFTKDGKILFSYYKNGSYNIYEYSPSYTNVVTNFVMKKYEEVGDSEVLTFPNVETKSYSPEFSIDYFIGGIAVNSLLGMAALGAVSMSDILGNHRYTLLMDSSMYFSNELFNNINFNFSYLNLTYRWNFGFYLFHYSNYFYELYTFRDFFDMEKPYFRRFGGSGILSYPFSTFDRIEFSLGYRQSDYVENVRYDESESRYSYDIKSISKNLISIQFVHDSTLNDITGPVDGQRYVVSFEQSVGLTESQLTYSRFILDYRRYFFIFPGYSLAFRGVCGGIFGPDETYYPFYLGGFNSLRGYDLFSFSGNSMFLFNLEFRFPLIAQWVIGIPFLIRMPTIWGSLFFDCGSAFDRNRAPIFYELKEGVFYFRDLKCSLGFGLRLLIQEGIKLFVDFATPYDGSYVPHISTWQTFWFIGIDF